MPDYFEREDIYSSALYNFDVPSPDRDDLRAYVETNADTDDEISVYRAVFDWLRLNCPDERNACYFIAVSLYRSAVNDNRRDYSIFHRLIDEEVEGMGEGALRSVVRILASVIESEAVREWNNKPDCEW